MKKPKMIKSQLLLLYQELDLRFSSHTINIATPSHTIFIPLNKEWKCWLCCVVICDVDMVLKIIKAHPISLDRNIFGIACVIKCFTNNSYTLMVPSLPALTLIGLVWEIIKRPLFLCFIILNVANDSSRYNLNYPVTYIIKC